MSPCSSTHPRWGACTRPMAHRGICLWEKVQCGRCGYGQRRTLDEPTLQAAIDAPQPQAPEGAIPALMLDTRCDNCKTIVRQVVKKEDLRPQPLKAVQSWKQ